VDGWALLREARWDEAREQAFRLYEEDGDATAAARMATWLAVDELDFRGAWPVATYDYLTVVAVRR
jgi:hypothetical protein